MKKFQVIKCKTCNKIFSACIDQFADDEWKDECDQYLKEGNSLVETIESIGNIFDDSPLNPCCGKPAVVGGAMNTAMQKTMLDFLNEVSVEEGHTGWHMVYTQQHLFDCNYIPQEAGRRYANWAISQMQPEWVAINSVEDLPEENGLYWTLRKGFEVPMYKEVFNDLDKDYWIENYSDYVRIVKPQPPTK